MKPKILLAVLCVVTAAGCSNRDKEEELQKQLSERQNDRESMQQIIAEKDKYVEEVIQAVNDVYKDLEIARVKEGKLKQRAGGTEPSAGSVTSDSRQKLLQDISEIGANLKENRKKVGDLQMRVRGLHSHIASLDTLVSTLRASLEERERSIAELQTHVQGLEASLAEKTKTIQENENLINDQERQINAGYYVIGTRDELKKKGIITDEGGFLWGLLGSTTILASGFDPTDFTPIDKTKDQTIHVQGRIEEILPRRQGDFFATSDGGENSSDLKIVQPHQFWQDKYLVIVVD
ncbi:MAG TPA: hypothetical protein VL126_01990 [Bacteroidota bacterium]|nr:hypothetical protein [Bacteroidota bacterium]